MKDVPQRDLLEVIGCEVERRPVGAPGTADLAPLVIHRTRIPGALAVDFPADALTMVEAFVAAERQCCGGIGWEVRPGSVLTLRITASESALDVIEGMLQNTI